MNFLALSFTIFFFSLLATPRWLTSLRIEPMYPAVEVQSLNHWTQGSSSSPILFHHFKDAWPCEATLGFVCITMTCSCWGAHLIVSLRKSYQKLLVQMSPSSVNPSLINTPCFQMDLTALYFLLRHFTTFLNGMNNTLFLQERKYSSLWVQGTKCDRNLSSWVHFSNLSWRIYFHSSQWNVSISGSVSCLHIRPIKTLTQSSVSCPIHWLNRGPVGQPQDKRDLITKFLQGAVLS